MTSRHRVLQCCISLVVVLGFHDFIETHSICMVLTSLRGVRVLNLFSGCSSLPYRGVCKMFLYSQYFEWELRRYACIVY